MAVRSERNKIRFQAKRAVEYSEAIQVNLKYIEELAGGRSQVINEHLPTIVFMVDNLQKVLISFRQAL